MAAMLMYGESLREKMLKGVNDYLKLAASSYGVMSFNRIIDENGDIKASNDSYLQGINVKFDNEFEALGYKLMKEASHQMSLECGDGRGLSSILTSSMINDGMLQIDNGANPIILRDGMNKALKEALKILDKETIKIDDKTIKDVALSASGSSAIAHDIFDAIKKAGEYGTISVIKGKTNETKLIETTGLRINQGLLNTSMLEDNNEITVEDPYILLTNTKLQSINDILPILEQIRAAGRPLIIIADDFESSVKEVIDQNNQNRVFKVYLIKAPGVGDDKRIELNNIRVFTGSIIYTEHLISHLRDASIDDLGGCSEVLISKTKTTIVGGYGNKGDINEQATFLKGLIDKSTKDYEKKAYGLMLQGLMGKAIQIAVGATLDSDSIVCQYQRALNSTMSAIKDGILAGGGISLYQLKLKIKSDGDEAKGEEVLINSLKKPTITLLKNAGINTLPGEEQNSGINVLTKKNVNMIKEGIVDSANLVKTALKIAVSIASSYLTSECAIIKK